AITVSGGPLAGVWPDALHVTAYFGEVPGNGTITGLDVATAALVAAGNPASSVGLPAFPLVDPAIVGDIAGDASIDATAVSDLAAFTSNLRPPPMPSNFVAITANGPDPTVSLGEPQRKRDQETRRPGDKSVSPGLP